MGTYPTRQCFPRQATPLTCPHARGAPSFVAFELTEWLEGQGADTYHIEPGKPWQNAYGESFHNRLRDECLNYQEFWRFAHARIALETWRCEYNAEHLHSSLGYATPNEFAARHSKAAVQNAV